MKLTNHQQLIWRYDQTVASP